MKSATTLPELGWRVKWSDGCVSGWTCDLLLISIGVFFHVHRTMQLLVFLTCQLLNWHTVSMSSSLSFGVIFAPAILQSTDSEATLTLIQVVYLPRACRNLQLS